jgi:undecaprenyl-phosphate 4-deoxy-4-formamido-L-arabinose transferase
MKISVIIPIYNSENIITKLIERIIIVLESIENNHNYEIILINDFSLDDSWTIIENLSKKYKFLKGISLKENYGQHNAIMCGLKYSSGNIIITMDDDFQHEPEFIKKIYLELKNSKTEVCYTYYLNRKHNFFKRIVSWFNNLFTTWFLGKSFNLYLSSFRGFKRVICDKLLDFKNSNVYIDGLILKSTKKISMISVVHFDRLNGNSNYTLKKLFLLWRSMLINYEPNSFKPTNFIRFFLKYFVLFFKNKKDNNKQYSVAKKTF